jgi:uncharacterized protein YutE (UPF0331/DUF86 family)
MKKDELKKYTLSELLEFEKAARVVCVRYENSTKNYDGSIINNSEYELFKKYNNFRNMVLNEIEKILDKEISGND